MLLRWFLSIFCALLAPHVNAQINLALLATATASASSGGAYGPANWTDGVLNGSFFGWVGTDPANSNFPQPAWMELAWLQPQTMNSVVLYNAGTNFMPPNGNAVVFAGSAMLQYWDGNAWVNLQPISGSGSFGDSIRVDFNAVTTTKLRIHQLATFSGAHNPGFDEWRVYQIQTDTVDAAITAVSFSTLVGPTGNLIQVKARVANRGNIPLQQPLLQYVVLTNPITGPITATWLHTLGPGDDSLYTFMDTQPAQGLNERQLCVWVSTPNDFDPSNDSLCMRLEGLNTAVSQLNTTSILAYPNPFQDVLYFTIPDGNAEMQCRIYDLQGQLLLETAGEISELRIPDDLSKGMYVLQIQQKGQRFVQKIIKD